MAGYQTTEKTSKGSHLVLNVNDKDVISQCPIKICYTGVPRENTLNTAKVTEVNDLIIAGSVPSWQNTDCFYKLSFLASYCEHRRS